MGVNVHILDARVTSFRGCTMNKERRLQITYNIHSKYIKNIVKPNVVTVQGMPKWAVS